MTDPTPLCTEDRDAAMNMLPDILRRALYYSGDREEAALIAFAWRLVVAERERDRLRAENERLRPYVGMFNQMKHVEAQLRTAMRDLQSERDSARSARDIAEAKLREREADCERLDWLEQCRAVCWETRDQGKSWKALVMIPGTNAEYVREATLRAAIDAARAASSPEPSGQVVAGGREEPTECEPVDPEPAAPKRAVCPRCGGVRMIREREHDCYPTPCPDCNGFTTPTPTDREPASGVEALEALLRELHNSRDYKVGAYCVLESLIGWLVERERARADTTDRAPASGVEALDLHVLEGLIVDINNADRWWEIREVVRDLLCLITAHERKRARADTTEGER